MTSPNLRLNIYDPNTLAAMDQAFAAIWHMLRTDDRFRDPTDIELRIAIGKKLLNLVAEGVTDPLRLRISPWRACFCHAIETHVVPPCCASWQRRSGRGGPSRGSARTHRSMRGPANRRSNLSQAKNVLGPVWVNWRHKGLRAKVRKGGGTRHQTAPHQCRRQ